MSTTTKLQEAFDTINPDRNFVIETIDTIKRINQIIDITLPELKAKLETNLIQADSVSVITIEAKAEMSDAIIKAEKTLSVEKIIE